MKRTEHPHENKSTKTIYYQFDSAFDLLQQATKECPHKKYLGRCKSRETTKEYFDFTKTNSFEEAIKLFRYGWQEGFDLIQALYKKHEDLFNEFFPRQDFIQTSTFDTTGMYVDVEKYITGDPECMVSSVSDSERTKLTTGNTHQRLIFNTGYHCGVNSETIFNNGAFLLCLTQSMLLHGFQIEIVVRDITTGSGQEFFGKNENKIQTDVLLKAFDEGIDLNKLAFALAHPSFLRRIWFAILENDPDLDFTEQIGLGYSYGTPFHGDQAKGLLPTDFLFKPIQENETLSETTKKFQNLVKMHFSETTINE